MKISAGKNAFTVVLLGIFSLAGSPLLAVAGTPPKAGPLEDIQATLDIILDQLDALQGDVDDLPGALGSCEVPPVWGTTYAGDVRFVPALDGDAYCDRETGLVWEGSPDATGGIGSDGKREWASATRHCAKLEVGGRKGWQLPLREQLASLVDTSNNNPALPTGHPFENVVGAVDTAYWSVTTLEDRPVDAWAVAFDVGDVFSYSKQRSYQVWCVRGDQSFDGNTH
jgi:hypothetical protein